MIAISTTCGENNDVACKDFFGYFKYPQLRSTFESREMILDLMFDIGKKAC